MKQYLSFILLFIFLATSALAADQYLYVRDGASGSDCSDWSAANACDAISTAEALIDRSTYDDVYVYIAGGAYTSTTLNAAASGAKVVYIKKATEAAHGTETGWLNSYDDAQVVITGGTVFGSNYWNVDGVTGGGPTSWTSGHGIKFYYASAGRIIDVSNYSNILLKHCEIGGPDRTTEISQRGIYGTSSDSLTISYCWVYWNYKGPIDVVHSDDLLIEYSKIGPNGLKAIEDPAIHSFGVSLRNNTNVTIRYNLFEDISETGYICVVNDDVYEAMTNVLIHGNIFHETGDLVDADNSIFFSAASTTNTTWTNLKFFNNTIANFSAWSNGGFNIVGSDGGGNEVYNNIWYNCGNTVIGFSALIDNQYNFYSDNNDTPTEDNRQVSTGNPFTSVATLDFSLVTPTTAGNSTIGATYSTDMLSTTRGSDGTWDRGAIEYDSGTPASTSSVGISLNGVNLQ